MILKDQAELVYVLERRIYPCTYNNQKFQLNVWHMIDFKLISE